MHFWSRISQKWCILETKLLKNTSRKSYAIYRMVPLSTTLSELWTRISWSTFLKWNVKKTVHLKDKVTIVQEETIPNIWNGSMFGGLDWPLNTSCGFVSISWASCLPARCLLVWYLLSKDGWLSVTCQYCV